MAGTPSRFAFRLAGKNVMNTFFLRFAVTILIKLVFALAFLHGMGWLRSAPQAPMPAAVQTIAAQHRAGLEILEAALEKK
jgi:hypothetical protein